jgi:anti-sigma factor RsiW
MTGPRRLECAEIADLAPLFVLDALATDETAAVRAHLTTCPEAHDEVAAFGGTAAYLAELPEPVEPPAALQGRLVAAVTADLAERQRTPIVSASSMGATDTPGPAPVPVPAGPQPGSATPVSLDTERARRRPASYLRVVFAAAAILLIIVLGASNLVLRGEIDAAEQQAALMRDAIAATGLPGARVASVSGTDVQPGASGFVVLPADGPGYLAVDGLSVPPAGRTYEAWTIGADGVPVPAGLASPSDGLLVIQLPPSSSTQVVALTIEPVGGSETPTMPLQAAGEVDG